MLSAPKKHQYALRAIYELALRNGDGPVKISEIAKAQAIPLRFLEVILNQLKGSGFVNSRRGFYGGYYLVTPPEKISVGDIMRYMQGTVDPMACMDCVSRNDCPLDNNCPFLPLWNRVSSAIFAIYDTTTIADLLKHGVPAAE